MPSLTVTGILFDLDGVLVESSPAVERHWRSFATRNDLDPAAVLARAHGRPSAEVIADFLASQALAREVEWFDEMEVGDVEGVVASSGAIDLLTRLPENRWSIVTSCGSRLAEARMSAAAIPVPSKIITADDVSNGKPDPEGYTLGVKWLGVPASSTVVLEDAPSGIEAALSAGTETIGVMGTFSANDLPSRYVISSLDVLSVEPSAPDHLVISW